MKKFRDSFEYAFNGLKEILISEKNFKTMFLIALAVIFAMFYFPTNYLDKAILLTVIFSVLILELINNVVEKIMDFLQSNQDERVKIIKDLMAAIVLLASIGAVIIGLIIFWPYFFK
ncbi:MAG: diacylglycerol kinase family protein [Patescibacteria group bacterium]